MTTDRWPPTAEVVEFEVAKLAAALLPLTARGRCLDCRGVIELDDYGEPRTRHDATCPTRGLIA